jgi:hypothetical protein
MRQIAGSFAQYQETRLVTKLRGARERIRETQENTRGASPTQSAPGASPCGQTLASALAQGAPKITEGDCERVGRDGLL